MKNIFFAGLILGLVFAVSCSRKAKEKEPDKAAEPAAMEPPHETPKAEEKAPAAMEPASEKSMPESVEPGATGDATALPDARMGGADKNVKKLDSVGSPPMGPSSGAEPPEAEPAAMAAAPSSPSRVKTRQPQPKAVGYHQMDEEEPTQE